MMTAGWFLSLDNVLVALALAPLCVKAGRLWVLAAWFAGVEAVAPVVGAVLGGAVPPLAGPAGTMQVAVLLTLGLGVLGMGALTFFPLPLREGVRGRGRWELATDRLSSLVRGPLPPTPSLKGRGSILHLRLHLNQHLHLHQHLRHLPPDPARLVSSTRTIAALALLLGLDNLLAGSAMPVPAAITCGLTSAVPVLLACFAGRRAATCLSPAGRAMACGVLLLTAAAISLT